MRNKLVVLNSNKESGEGLRAFLESQHYPTRAIQSLSKLEGLLRDEDHIAVIIDIDSVPVDNRTIRHLALKYPGVRFLGTSKDKFHPELKDAICYHMYACLNKPVDPDELLFWIKSIYEEENKPGT
jgi:DNA-binding NtrC family response regulator